jgi:hypothetical protein
MSKEVRLMPRFNRLRGLGPLGNALATSLTFLTTNWQIVVSVIAATAAGAVDWLRAIALNPTTIAGVGAFLAVLWTIIGITVLIDRRRPRTIRTHPDYRWGLTFEGFEPRYTRLDAKVPEPGSLHFMLSLRNYLPYPIHYEFDHLDIRIGTRAIQRIQSGALAGFMPRGGSRTSTIRGFVQSELKEFYGRTEAVKGSAEFSVIYGPPEGPPERRLKMAIDIHVLLLDDGNSFGWQENIISDADEEYSRP